MKKTFEIKGVDLTSLYGVGDKNILFLEKQLPIQLNVRGNNIFCQGLKKDINHFDSVLNQMVQLKTYYFMGKKVLFFQELMGKKI